MNFADLYKKLQAIEENAPVAPVHTDGAGAGDSYNNVEECGDMMSPRPEQQDNVTMNVSMNGSGKGGIKDLMAILKNIEDNGPTPGHSDHDMIVGMEDFKNSMAGASGQHTAGVDSVTATGDDLASKGQEAPKVNGGGNPMQEAISQRLQKMYDTIKEETTEEGWNPNTWFGGKQPAQAAGAPAADGGGYDAMGNPTTSTPSASPTAVAKPAGQAAKPARVAAKPDPNVMALQQKLIAAGAKIKADGIMGPATRAAQQQFPNVTTQTDAEKAVGADINSADKTPAAPAAPVAPAAPAAAPAPGMQAVGDDDGNTTITRPDGSTMVVGADGKQIMPGSNPNLPQNKGIINTIKNAATGQGDFQKPTGFIPPTAAAPAAPAAPAAAPASNLTTSDGKPVTDGSGKPVQAGTPTAESVTFGQDPALARIVQLARG